MASPDSLDVRDSAPWDARRVPSGKHLLSRILSWSVAVFLVFLIAWGLWPRPIHVETGLVARSPLTVHVSEEGKTRVRNRYVVAAPVAGKMRRVLLKVAVQEKWEQARGLGVAAFGGGDGGFGCYPTN